jgi:hypothetical protein
LTRFAHAVREELWSRGRRLESRLAHGQAIEESDGSITASDARDDALVARAEAELERLRQSVPKDALVRLVAEASTERIAATMTVRIGAASVVTDPEHVHEDVALLRGARVAPAGPVTSRRTPILWRNGSGAVLLHELIGHPLEHDHPVIELPSWLHADIPLRMRRATFRDVPLLRMEHVRVTQTDAPFDVPEERVEVSLVDSGAYEPLTGNVTIRVAASTVGAFEIVEPRSSFVFLGASGPPRRYPGVICSREGQELVVGSYAPDMLTGFR